MIIERWWYAQVVLSVQRLCARAQLDDSPEALTHASAEAAAGDESWQQWVAEYQRGEALILRLELTLEIGDGEREVLRSASAGLFIECDVHTPVVEQQIAELAAGDFVALARELTARGLDLNVYELAEMYVHVELDEAVRHELLARHTPRTGGRPPPSEDDLAAR